MKQKLFTILTLLVLCVTGAWADDVLLTSVDFTNTTNFPAATYGSTDEDTQQTVNGVFIYTKKGSKYIKVNNTTAGVDFCGQNMDNSNGKHGLAIPVTGVNGKLVVKVNHTYNNTSASFKVGIAHATDNDPSKSQTFDLSPTNSGTKNKNDFTITKTGLTGTDYIVWVGESGGSYTVIKSVEIYTTAPSGKLKPNLTVSPTTATLAKDGTQQLTPSQSGNGAISYETSNSNVATVSNTGLVTAVGYGSATITVTSAETDDYDEGTTTINIIVKEDVNVQKYAKFNIDLTCSPEGFATISGAINYNGNYPGTYGGESYTKGLKMQSDTQINFTTTSASCDLIVVQSTNTNVNNFKIDDVAFATDYDTKYYYDEPANKVRVHVYKGLASGNHTIIRAESKELGILYVGVTEAPAPSLSVSPTTASAFAYAEGNGPSEAQTFTVTGSNLTSAITATLSNTTNYEMKTGDGEYGAGPLTDLASGTAIQVRLKAGLAKGDSYNGNLTFSTTGADNKVIALTGSVTGQTYTVTYDLNGASGDVPTQAATEEGGKFNLAAAPTRTCYTFNGWKCNVDNVTYAANDEYTMTAAPTTFTAQWTANYSTSLDFAAVTLAKINDGTNPPAIATFLAGGNMVAEGLGSRSEWETGEGDWGGTIKTGFLGYKLKDSGAKVSFLAPAGKLVTIVLGSVGANVTLSKNGTTSTISKKSGDDAETIVTPFIAGEDVLVSLTTTSTSTVTLKKILISDYATATISAAEYATFVNADKALDFTTTGITVYTAQDKQTSVGLTEIENGQVPANTPVVLYKEGADGSAIYVPAIASAADIEGTNDLRVSTGTDVDYMYVLAMNPTIGFYPWTGTNLPAGKIYLQGKASYGAREFLGFDANTTTAIDNVVVKTFDANAPMYNLAGQRVNKSYKGVVIVNGKKYMNK